MNPFRGWQETEEIQLVEGLKYWQLDSRSATWIYILTSKKIYLGSRDTARGGFKYIGISIDSILDQPLGIIYAHNIMLLTRMILPRTEFTQKADNKI
jgi:hypothetical protein